jgi:predicted RNase H-like HicB family nuclease
MDPDLEEAIRLTEAAWDILLDAMWEEEHKQPDG